MESHEILKMLNKLLEDQDISLTPESPGEKYLKEDEMELIKFQRSSGSGKFQCMAAEIKYSSQILQSCSKLG